MIFTTRSATHLTRTRAPVDIHSLADGELYLRLLRMPRQQATVIASFPPPAENLVESILLLDALKQAGAKPQLVIPYFGYARQDRVCLPGEPVSARAIAEILTRYTNDITIIDCHSRLMKDYLRFRNVIPVRELAVGARKPDIIIGPDLGATEHARLYGRYFGVPSFVLRKERPRQNTARVIGGVPEVSGKNVLIVDDIIDTAGTVIAAAKALDEKGADRVDVLATHGLFSSDALDRIDASPIQRVVVSNTVQPKIRHRMVRRMDISPSLTVPQQTPLPLPILLRRHKEIRR
ncbi:ribose-phosphate pyrophosphokinase [Candidatus Woesearchaeota archaeon]|nr:ribose-phosphate pyrophosphokinase [Candidatus Woesearchaeota archaeon]